MVYSVAVDVHAACEFTPTGPRDFQREKSNLAVANVVNITSQL